MTAATTTTTLALAELRAEWDLPYLADPADDIAWAARRQLTRELAAAILASDLWDAERQERARAGDLRIARAGWSRERGEQADAAGEPGTPEWKAALGAHEHATLTGDGGGAIREAWCECVTRGAVPFTEWVQYEHWTAEGREAHGFVHEGCRRLLQAG